VAVAEAVAKHTSVQTLTIITIVDSLSPERTNKRMMYIQGKQTGWLKYETEQSTTQPTGNVMPTRMHLPRTELLLQ